MRKQLHIFPCNCQLQATCSSLQFLIKIKYFAVVKTIFSELLLVLPLVQLKQNEDFNLQKI